MHEIQSPADDGHGFWWNRGLKAMMGIGVSDYVPPDDFVQVTIFILLAEHRESLRRFREMLGGFPIVSLTSEGYCLLISVLDWDVDGGLCIHGYLA